MIRKKSRRGRWGRRFKKRTIDLKKGLVLLPHLFTFGNAFFGFCSVIWAVRGEIRAAAFFILLGALMDALDGRTARFVGTTSEFGLQLDSLADVISFGFAPAFMVYVWLLHSLGFVGLLISFLFVVAGMARLARFNIIHAEQAFYFLGLPVTMAGCLLAAVTLTTVTVAVEWWFVILIALLMLLLSFLMISSLRFPTFKQRLFREKKNWQIVVGVILFAIIAVMRIDSALFVMFIIYFAFALRDMIKSKGGYKGLE
jgi:CDP-diacylglycerol--serine O-phosphatidyltransferase